jgi:hypothetical protein
MEVVADGYNSNTQPLMDPVLIKEVKNLLAITQSPKEEKAPTGGSPSGRS